MLPPHLSILFQVLMHHELTLHNDNSVYSWLCIRTTTQYTCLHHVLSEPTLFIMFFLVTCQARKEDRFDVHHLPGVRIRNLL